MDFDILLNGYDYKDLDSNYNSESKDKGPDMFEPPDSPLPSPELPPSPFPQRGPQRMPSPTPSLPEPILPKILPLPIRPGDKPPLAKPPNTPPSSAAKKPKTKQSCYAIGARIQALTLLEHGGKDANRDKIWSSDKIFTHTGVEVFPAQPTALANRPL
jgi:hypothetical protein